MIKSKIFKQRIISFSIILALCIMSGFFRSSNIFNTGYETVEEAVIHEKSISNEDIVMVLNSSNLYLVSYDKGPRKVVTAYSDRGKFFFNHSNSSEIFYQLVETFTISVQKLLGKVTIEISRLASDSPVSIVTDSLDSIFSYGKSEFSGLSDETWFLVLDKIPEDYLIIINGKSIEVKNK